MPSGMSHVLPATLGGGHLIDNDTHRFVSAKRDVSATYAVLDGVHEWCVFDHPDEGSAHETHVEEAAAERTLAEHVDHPARVSRYEVR